MAKVLGDNEAGIEQEGQSLPAVIPRMGAARGGRGSFLTGTLGSQGFI